MGRVGKDAGNNHLFLLTRADGSLVSDGKDNTYHYKKIDDDTEGHTETVWDPEAGKQIHLRALLVSVTAAGIVEIYDNATGTTIFNIPFEKKGTVPAAFRGGILLAADNLLGARYECDAGNETAYITAVGHED